MINGLVMWVSFMFLMSWVPAQWKRRIVGYGFISDVSVHVVLQVVFGGDAAGRVSMLFAGVLINASMHLYRRLAGYEKFTMEGWQQFTAKGTPLNLKS